MYNFNLRDFRENKLKLTQTQLADLVGESQDTISRYENNPERIPMTFFFKLAEKTGVTLDQLGANEKTPITPIRVDDIFSSAVYFRENIIDYIDNSCPAGASEKHAGQIEELRSTILNAVRKPKIAVIGRSDVGKSALINTINGQEKLPTSWSPTTSIVVYLKHILDKPNFIDSDVWIFKASLNERDRDKDSPDDQSWNDTRLHDEGYCRKWLLAAGDISTLQSYGTRQGVRSSNLMEEAGSAVVFVDSDILKNCDIMDLPGYGTGDRKEDDALSLNASQRADILIYMSIANGFMRDEDINYLREWIKTFNLADGGDNATEPLSNLFIVASQAHTVSYGNRDELKYNVLDKGCERFLYGLSDEFWETFVGQKLTYDDFRARFFTFTMDIMDLRKDLEDGLTQIIEELPKKIKEKAISLVKDYAADAKTDIYKEIVEYTEMLDEKEKYELRLSEIERNEPQREAANKAEREIVDKQIHQFHTSSLAEFTGEYNRIISIDFIVEAIKRKGYRKKKDDVGLLSSYLSSTLEEHLHKILKSKSEKLAEVVEKYIAYYEQSVSNAKFSNPNLAGVPFNAKRAFASGLAGLVTFGGLALWAATLGNLGAYILVAKGVSLLAALGIHVGGTAAAISAVSAIGGPIVLGIALAVMAAMAFFAIFSGGWQKSLAKKFVKVYEEQGALSKYKSTITTFWRDTQVAFDSSANNMEREWKDYVDNLRGIINNYDVDDIKRRIAAAEKIKDFFANIPL